MLDESDLIGGEDGNEGIKEVPLSPRAIPGKGLVRPAEGDAIAKALNDPGLPYFEENAYRLNQSAAANANLVSRLFGGSVNQRTTTIVQYACRWREEDINGKQTRVGVIIQLAAAATDFNATVDLSLPVIAASGELKMSRARIAIFLAGYVGKIEENMSIADFNVENYGKFMETYEKLKMRILNATEEDKAIKPVAFTVPKRQS